MSAQPRVVCLHTRTWLDAVGDEICATCHMTVAENNEYDERALREMEADAEYDRRNEER